MTTNVLKPSQALAHEFRNVSQANRFIANAYVCRLSVKDPGINISLRTQQASAKVVQILMDRTSVLHSLGLLEDEDLEAFMNMFNRKRYLIRELPPRMEIPKQRKVLRNFSWLHNDKMAQRYIVHEAEMLHFEPGSTIVGANDEYKVHASQFQLLHSFDCDLGFYIFFETS